jgi:hypothetical protein
LVEGEDDWKLKRKHGREANMTKTKNEPAITLNSEEVKDLSGKIMDTIGESRCKYAVMWMALLRTLTTVVGAADQDFRHELFNDLEAFSSWIKTAEEEMKQVVAAKH